MEGNYAGYPTSFRSSVFGLIVHNNPSVIEIAQRAEKILARFFVALFILSLVAGNIWAEDVLRNNDVLLYNKGLATHLDKLPFKQTHLSLLAKGFQQAVEGLREVLVVQIKEGSSIPTQTLFEIEGKMQLIKTIDVDIMAALEMEGNELKEKGFSLEVQKRHEEFMHTYQIKAARLMGYLDSIMSSTTGDTDSVVQEALNFIDQDLLSKIPSIAPLSPELAPVSTQPDECWRREKGIIIDKDATFSDVSFPLSQIIDLKTTGVPLSMDNDSFSSGEAKAPPLSSSASPVLGQYDLAETRDIWFTQEIKDLATSLDHDPVKMFEWVHNNIDYLPYYGSYKGSQHTLLERSGNDWDMCSLLMALYRASNIPCRYKRASIRMDAQTLQNWLGVKDVNTAADVLWEAYVPISPIWDTNKNLIGLSLEHVIVDAYLSYGNYRGNINDSSEGMWIQLDPSFKGYEYIEGNDKVKDVVFDREGYLSGTTTLSPIKYYKQQIVSQGISIEDTKRKRSIKQERFEILPSGLPYYGNKPYYKATGYIGSPLSRLTINHRVRVEITSSRTYITQQMTDVPGLYGKRLTIIYRAASPEDQRLIDEGKIHLAELQADMRADGELIASSFCRGGLRIGETEELKLYFIPPNPGIGAAGLTYRDDLGERQYLGYPHPLYAGAIHNLSFDMAGDAARLVHNRLEEFIQKESDDENVLSDEVMGELLYLAGLKYLQDTETEINELASLNGYINHRRIWSALTVQRVKPVILAGLPTYLELTTNLINAAVPNSYSDLSFAIDGRTSRDGEIKRLGMMNASFYEHKLWEDVVGIEAISTIKALQYAKSIGITIHTIDASNIEEIEQLNLSNERKQELRELLDTNKHPGYRLIIPHSEFSYEDWTGIGYIWEHVEGGWGGYFISGGVNGGETVWAAERSVWETRKTDDALWEKVVKKVGKIVKPIEYGQATGIGAQKAVKMLGKRIMNKLIECNEGELKNKTAHEKFQEYAKALDDCKKDGTGDSSDIGTMLQAVRMIDANNGSELYRRVLMDSWLNIINAILIAAGKEAITP